ncbi:response regulator [Maribacter cobaltidurans]|uniref:Uncharacterized protein n=1 Tax=Maribacter cobaltidurans TaxID=1178778 RepID=A0A223V5R2_9FLAO|nr:response regulator [Maribacter cobaltidurans]ASV30751.1 hypothetical protein CJ263_11275 [Maribacter cobaltidurans]GGD81478.1 hypothetical protein GCM10011412_19000 [Maribacter cobaltidurans]
MKSYNNIYLIDDFETVNFLHTMLLKRLGFQSVFSFTNPEEGLKVLLENRNSLKSSLILLDINMPEMNGFEFLDCLLKEGITQSLDVIIVSSSISEKDKRLALEYPEYVRHFLNKPLESNQLKTLLELNENSKLI